MEDQQDPVVRDVHRPRGERVEVPATGQQHQRVGSQDADTRSTLHVHGWPVAGGLSAALPLLGR